MLYSAFLLILIMGTFIFEFKKVISTQSALFSEEEAALLNANSEIDYFNYSNNGNRVLFIVLDGLRYDMTTANAELNEFLNDPEIANNSLLLQMSAQLPSMSVPNWVTLITGAPPESTGVLGNLLVPETNFDTIFYEAKRFGLNRGLTGSPWFSTIVYSTLPILDGDATLPTNYGSNVSTSANVADEMRCNITLQALAQQENPFTFFLTHFSDIDIQGHCCGVTTEWNKRNTYQSAVTNKTALLRQLVANLPPGTVLVAAADHGHIDRGGHGGVAPILRQVPLFIFKNNSNLRSVGLNSTDRFYPHSQTTGFSNQDVAATLTAILGLPAPRQSYGRFVDDVLRFVPEEQVDAAYVDLYKQKYQLTVAFAAKFNLQDRLPLELLANQPRKAYVDGVNQLIALTEELRVTAQAEEVRRNFLVSSLCILVLFGFTTYASSRGLIAYLFFFFGQVLPFAQHVLPATLCCSVLRTSPLSSNHHSQQSNRAVRLARPCAVRLPHLRCALQHALCDHRLFAVGFDRHSHC
jgi:hypothetical protein